MDNFRPNCVEKRYRNGHKNLTLDMSHIGDLDNSSDNVDNLSDNVEKLYNNVDNMKTKIFLGILIIIIIIFVLFLNNSLGSSNGKLLSKIESNNKKIEKIDIAIDYLNKSLLEYKSQRTEIVKENNLLKNELLNIIK